MNAPYLSADHFTHNTYRGRDYIGPFYLVGFGAGAWELRSDESGVIFTGSRSYVIRTAVKHGFLITEK